MVNFEANRSKTEVGKTKLLFQYPFAFECRFRINLLLVLLNRYFCFVQFRRNGHSGLLAVKQRWSRGHKARGQGQGHKKNPRPRPRPRTASSRTEPLEAKDRNARGQGQGPRTQAQVFSEKKVFKNFFQAISNSLAYLEFLIGRGLNHKSHAMTSSKFFQRGSFCLTKIS